MFKKLGASLAKKLGIKYALGEIRAAAEGRRGPEWKARYWWLAGKKRWVSFILGAAAAVLFAVDQEEAAASVATVAGIAYAAGVADKGWRTEIPLDLKESKAYRFLAAHSGAVAVTFSTAIALVQNDYCFGADCDTLTAALGVITALAIHVKLLDEGYKAMPPLVHLEDDAWRLDLPGGTTIAGTREDLEAMWRHRSEVR